MKARFHLLAGLALAVSALPSAAPAVDGALHPQDAVQASMLPGWRRDDGTHITALRLTLAPGWKTYWRVPGEGGIPPSFSWEGSENLARVTARWPRPFAYRTNGLQSIGYTGELLLPLEMTPRDDDVPIHVEARIELGVCEDICMPVTLRLDTDLGTAGVEDPRIRRALADQPVSATAAGVSGATCRITPIKNGLRITARIGVAPLGGPKETVVFELADPDIWVGEAETHREGGTLVAETEFVSYAEGGIVLDRSRLRLTLLGDRQAVDIQGCPAE
ncbi:hypothetical protein DDZ14_11315 [Maritimibacter sp. 55A14]|uniref:protein-disulfide reductase DsbD domain-containing protein n=1 Tax=Maritimibacter sp. 55A14 TaxID=2174844 RepID=UPI000D60A83F|nr:protein-disulfide reductase DsbD domain-containing protein [Maritimibacter sp. 55A14]PWE32309.1 hypothetical protein DDZ14_11315 [Maritimibacter sp. 55A14]